MSIITLNKDNFNLTEIPNSNEISIGYDTDGILKQIDEFGNISPIANGGSLTQNNKPKLIQIPISELSGIGTDEEQVTYWINNLLTPIEILEDQSLTIIEIVDNIIYTGIFGPEFGPEFQ